VREFIEQYAKDQGIDAGVIVSMVGSFQTAAIRFAGRPQPTVLKGPFEIVSVTGTLSDEGAHVHLAIADENGKVLAGHMSKGSIVNTTVELVILNISSEWRFERVVDPVTGDKELKCVPKNAKPDPIP